MRLSRCLHTENKWKTRLALSESALLKHVPRELAMSGTTACTIPCRRDAAKRQWFGHLRGWSMHRDAQVSFSLGCFGLSESCTPSSWWVPYSSTKPTSLRSLWLYLCTIHSRLKHRQNRRHPDWHVTGRALAGPRGACNRAGDAAGGRRGWSGRYSMFRAQL